MLFIINVNNYGDKIAPWYVSQFGAPYDLKILNLHPRSQCEIAKCAVSVLFVLLLSYSCPTLFLLFSSIFLLFPSIFLLFPSIFLLLSYFFIRVCWTACFFYHGFFIVNIFFENDQAMVTSFLSYVSSFYFNLECQQESLYHWLMNHGFKVSISSLSLGVFNAFDVNSDNHIDLKEMACGLSACCRGPRIERQKCKLKGQYRHAQQGMESE